jgi:hypothetical protein
MDLSQIPRDLATQLRQSLLALARIEEELANREAARVPYWAPCPASVQGHRAAAQALRARADRLAWVH